MKRGVLLLAALVGAAVCLSLALERFWGVSTGVVAPVGAVPARTLILDAGHGGEDGGAVSLTGVSESQINLAIVLKLEDILALYGRPAVVLRREDVSLHDRSAVTIREKKVSDLQNRAAMVEGVEGGILLSIHQNTYPDGRYSGAQVFYAPTQGSQELAGHIQQALRTALQPDNSRESKPIPDSVYLMNHVSCPAVLVECGFLTNPEEEERLRDEDFQRKLAAVLAWGWLTFPEAGTGKG